MWRNLKSGQNLNYMERSDKVIEYKAYVRYLRGVTGSSADPGHVRADVMARTFVGTEIRMVWMIMKKIIYVSFAVAAVALCAAALSYLTFVHDTASQDGPWAEAREDAVAHEGRLRIYDAYEHSSSLRNIFK